MEENELDVIDIVEKDPSSISEDEKNYLSQHQDDLTSDELTKFGFAKNELEEPKIKYSQEDIEEKKEDVDEDEELINKTIQKAIDPIKKQYEKSSKKAELAFFLSQNNDYNKYSKQIEKITNNFPNLPIDQAAKLAASDDLMKLGARAERKAQRKVSQSKNYGNDSKQVLAKKNWLTASKEEFEAEKKRIMVGRY